jgi:hypothetical protein
LHRVVALAAKQGVTNSDGVGPESDPVWIA